MPARRAGRSLRVKYPPERLIAGRIIIGLGIGVPRSSSRSPSLKSRRPTSGSEQNGSGEEHPGSVKLSGPHNSASM